MRYQVPIALAGACLGAALLNAQKPPDCNNPITRDVDVRCACIKDPGSQACSLVKSGFYEPHDMGKIKDAYSASTWSPQPAQQPTHVTVLPRSQPIRPQQARVVPLAHKDYLRFLQPNARFAVGIDFDKLSRSPELMSALFDQPGGPDGNNQIAAALKEMDHLWLSFAPPGDVVLLMTGKFEQGAATGMFYASGIRPVFLNDAHAMLVGPEPSVQAALARLNRPASAAHADAVGWVTRRSRELAKDHETWIALESPAHEANGSPLGSIRQFALGVKIAGQGSIDGEAIADSEAGAEKIAAWVDQMKAALRKGATSGVLDALNVQRTGATIRFSAEGDALVEGDAGKTAMNSDLGAELYSTIMSGFPGAPARAVAADKLLAVKAGMKREELLGLLGKPLAVSKIQGLDVPRETWTYQAAFGKQITLRLDDGVLTGAPE